MATEAQFRDRAYKDADLQAVTDLLNACDAVDKMDESYTPEDVEMEIGDPEFDKARDLRVWEDGQGNLVALAKVRRLPSREDGTLDGVIRKYVHPDARDMGLEDETIGWMEQRIRQAAGELGIPGRLRGSTRDYDTEGRKVFERNGMSVVRYFFVMKRDLAEPIAEPVFPEGFTLTHSKGIADVEKWVEMFNLSFIDHWNHHPATVDNMSFWLQSPKYEPERDLIAVAPDGTFAAFCFCWIDPDDNERNNRLDGWIDMLGTRRGYRKIGLGRAMLLSGLHRLKTDGMTVAKLGVDAENPTGALQLYESTGFVTEFTSVVYRKDV